MVQSQNITVARGLAIVVLATIQNVESLCESTAKWFNGRCRLTTALLGADWSRKDAVREVVFSTISLVAFYALAFIAKIL